MSGRSTCLLSDEETTKVFMKKTEDGMPLDQIQRGGRFRAAGECRECKPGSVDGLGAFAWGGSRLTHRARFWIHWQLSLAAARVAAPGRRRAGHGWSLLGD